MALSAAIVPPYSLGCKRRADTRFPDEHGASAPAYADGSLSMGPHTRAWHVKVPTRAREGRPLPLVVALHGGGGTGLRMNALTGFDALAEREGFFVVYPEGIDKGWNDGRADNHTTAAREDVPDVAFLRAMLDEVERAYVIDRARVYMTGISNGAMMACRFACEAAERVAGVALVAGAMPHALGADCAPSRPVSVLVIGGTADPIVPYAGGEVRLPVPLARGRGMVLSADATVDAWARLDGCDGAPDERAVPDLDPDDGSTVRLRAWTRCKEGTAVELARVDGGGHTWPGGWQYLDERLIGKTNRDIDAREVIGAFFLSHPRAP